MRIALTDAVNNTVCEHNVDFDETWEKLGKQIKGQLKTFDRDLTWLNLYLSHDGKPSFVRTIQALTQDE